MALRSTLDAPWSTNTTVIPPRPDKRLVEVKGMMAAG